jgi:hypothetical protein
LFVDLSRMRENSHVRFSGGPIFARRSGYPTAAGAARAAPIALARRHKPPSTRNPVRFAAPYLGRRLARRTVRSFAAAALPCTIAVIGEDSPYFQHLKRRKERAAAPGAPPYPACPPVAGRPFFVQPAD